VCQGKREGGCKGEGRGAGQGKAGREAMRGRGRGREKDLFRIPSFAFKYNGVNKFFGKTKQKSR
jgi:hypothetical protein